MTGTDPRVVITGIGMVTGLGTDRDSTWQALVSGAGAVRRLDFSQLCQGAGMTESRLPGFSETYLGAPVEWPGDLSVPTVFDQEPNIRMAKWAAEEALADAQVDWDTVKPPRRGCVIGTSKGGMQSISRLLAAELSGEGSATRPPELWSMFWPNTPASSVAERWKIRGPVLCPVAACATGLMSLWRGAELIREGVCDVVLAGSTDASLQPSVLGAFSRMGVIAKATEDPRRACRPFDQHRSGFVVGEGAAVLVMERADGAWARGITPYAEWLGGGCVSDPTGIAHLDEDATGLIWLIKDVLKRTGVTPGDIDYINLHGTGTWGNDRTETRAVREALGEHADRVSCSSLKGSLGHLLGAAGSVETACTLLAMRQGQVPPTRNLDHPDPDCDLDYTPNQTRSRTIRHALKLSLGFGGHQVAALFGAWGSR